MTSASVVDASALCSVIFFEPEGASMAARLENVRLVAPELIDFEVGNTCLKKIKRNPDLERKYLSAYAGFLKMPITRVKVDPGGVLNLARHSGLTFYDASYLWLARHLKLNLLTLDQALEKAASNP